LGWKDESMKKLFVILFLVLTLFCPKIIFADEPTGNLDSINSRKIQELFFLIREQLKISLVIVTHDLHFAQKFPKVMHLKDGNWN
jgi:lipoprotein-releasing system ATP-binding protein